MIIELNYFLCYNPSIMRRYIKLNEYLKDKFGERVLKIGIDGGFTCPNRDGTLDTGGCIFCSERGSGEHLKNTESISMQVKNHLLSYRGKRANKFIAYFQNYTNTYDTVENLKQKYDAALIDDKIIGLAIATRPDCINEDIAKLLNSYMPKYSVWVELGLQTANEEIGKIIHRKYTNNQFQKAVLLLNQYNIDVIAHIIVGLPNEDEKSIQDTVLFLNSLPIKGLKVHSCYVVKNTKLAQMYENGEYTPITLDYYLNTLSYIITHLRPDIVLHRISGDAPKDFLLAPDWNLHKKWIINGIDKKLESENLWQGMYYEKAGDNNATKI